MLTAGLAGCSPNPDTPDLTVGDCLRLGGSADRPQATEVPCGGPESNFKVAATVKGGPDQCPADADSSYSMHTAFGTSNSTACLDIDWVIGGCMSVDPEHGTDPVRVDCNDRGAAHRQRATQILHDVANADQCASGLGYAYDERRFTVCVEDVT